MSKFNKSKTTTPVVNLAGGKAYKESSELELISLLLTSFGGDKFYRSESDETKKLREILTTVSPYFACQAALYARNEAGMRTITHVLASELAPYIASGSYARTFYDKIIHRLDDISEIVAYHKGRGQKISNAMKAGFARAIARFDEYAMAKYRGENKDFKLVDIVNLVHPKPTEKSAEALKALVNGTLRSTETWESKLTVAGQVATSEEDLADRKDAVWSELLKENKIGYFAILRNLANIIKQSPESLPLAIEKLTDRDAIKKSLVLPFRFYSAYKALDTLTATQVNAVMRSLSTAVDISCDNVPKFSGRTLVALDESGSMQGLPSDIGSLFAAVILKANPGAELLLFAGGARYPRINSADSIMTIKKSIPFNGGSTNFDAIFETAQGKYDRVIILSDMQSWEGHNRPTVAFKNYKARTGADPIVYSFDLAGLGTLQFPERNVYCLAGFSDKVFDIMSSLETDKNALVNTVKAIKL